MEELARQLRECLPALPATGAPASGNLVCEADPLAFWAQLARVIESGGCAILADPAWPADWRTGLASLVSGDWRDAGWRVLIPTGGSSGRPKLCIHDAGTLGAAATAYAERIGRTGIVNAVSVLTQHHVGGLMAVFRAAACGGRVHFADYRDLAGIRRAPFSLATAALSLVPTQLGRMLGDADLRALLAEFGLILVGGAGCPANLLATARTHGIRLAPCYGSTETAAMVTLLDPDEFLAGRAGVGAPLPHARIAAGPGGRLEISAASNLRGYFPGTPDFTRIPFSTNDIGHIDSDGHLHVHGRADRVIITGGEKVHPELVEAAAMETGLLDDARCEGVPDPDWGARIVLHVVPHQEQDGDGPVESSRLLEQLRGRLPAYALPKEVVFHEKLQRSATGKWRDPA